MIGLMQPRQMVGIQSPASVLACPILAGRLGDVGLEAHSVNIGALGVTENWILEGLGDYEAFGIVASSRERESARRLLALIRRHRPDAYVACMGTDPTLYPSRYRDWGASCVVVGEPTGIIADVFTQRVLGVVQGHSPQHEVPPLWETSIPTPWEARPGWAPLRAGFGSRHSMTVLERQYDYLASQNVTEIALVDDALISPPRGAWATEVIRAARGRFTFSARGAPHWDHGCHASFATMHQLGLREIEWDSSGFEMGLHEALETTSAYDSLDLASKAGVHNDVDIHVGLPGETVSSAIANRQALSTSLALSLIHEVRVRPWAPIPGTQWYARAEIEGWLWDPDPNGLEVRGAGPWMSQGDLVEHANATRSIAVRHDALRD